MTVIREYLYACPECGAKNVATLLLSYFDPGGFTVWSDGYREGGFGEERGFFRCHACGAVCDQSVLEGEEWTSDELAVPAYLRNLEKKVPAKPGEARYGDRIYGLELARAILADASLAGRHAEYAYGVVVDAYWHKTARDTRPALRREYEAARDALAALLKKGGRSALKLAELYRWAGKREECLAALARTEAVGELVEFAALIRKALEEGAPEGPFVLKEGR